MATADRRAREKEVLRQKILDTARELFVKYGYEGVTLRKIAESIEYAPGTIYSYFTDKEQLMRALCLADWEAFEQSFPRDAQPDDPLAGIRGLGTAYIGFALAHPNQYRLMFITPKPPELKHELDEETLAMRGDPTRDGYALLKGTVQAAIDAQLLRPELTDAELVAQTLWAGVHGMASLEISLGHDPWLAWASVEKRIRLILDALLHGLARNEATRP